MDFIKRILHNFSDVSLEVADVAVQRAKLYRFIKTMNTQYLSIDQSCDRDRNDTALRLYQIYIDQTVIELLCV